MSRFRCTHCSLLAERQLPPLMCPDTSLCDWESTDTVDVSHGWDAAGHVADVSSGTPPEAVQEGTPPLTLVIGAREWRLRGETVLGRNGDIAVETFRDHLSVSRKHCRIAPTRDGWQLTPLSTSSPTLLDGRSLAVGQPVSLAGGTSRLVLGDGLTVEIRLSPLQRPDPAPTSQPFGALEEHLNGRR